MVLGLFVIAAAATIGGRRILNAQSSGLATPIAAPPTQSYLVILGIGDRADTSWDGSITATGTTILSLQGWRFAGTDAISGTTSWKINTRPTPSLNPPGPIQENGVIVTVAAPTGAVTLAVQTKGGNFNFSPAEVPFGVTKTFTDSFVMRLDPSGA